MKKMVKKLVLTKETVRSLEEKGLDKAAGASAYICVVNTEYNSCMRYCQREPNIYG